MKTNRKVISINDQMIMSLGSKSLKDNEMESIDGGGVFPDWLVDTLEQAWETLKASL